MTGWLIAFGATAVLAVAFWYAWNRLDRPREREEGADAVLSLLDAWYLQSDDEGMVRALGNQPGAALQVVWSALAEGDDIFDFLADRLLVENAHTSRSLSALRTALQAGREASVDADWRVPEVREGETTGEILSGRLSLSLEPTEDGTFIWVFREITEPHREREELDDRLAILSRALDRAPFGILLADGDTVIQESNTAFRRLIGGRAVTGEKVSMLAAEEDREHLSGVLEDVLSSGGQAPPVDIRTASDREGVITLYASQAKLSGGQENGLMIHAIDATDRKRLEQQFAQSQKMQAVGQLAGGVAHDFNNVLTAIIGFCDLLLQRHQPGDPSFADVMQIQQNANRAAGLIRQLLAFSRQQSIRPRVLDFSDVLADLSNLLRRLLGETVELSVVHGRDLWAVKADQGQLEQIIINLAVNARDAMKGGGGRLIIQTDNFQADRPYEMRGEIMPKGAYVMISVTDNGVGMSAETLDHVFEPFFTTKEVGEGTGLGLAMVFGSVRQMGGYVVAHSDGVGKGATFSIYLPRAEGAAEVVASDDKATAIGDVTGGGSILLVEDEDAVRLFSARALRSKGYQVTEARTGESALELLEESRFDLIVTDMVMPKVDGATLIREARKTMPDLPVICISGYTQESIAREVSELPQVYFLPKPFSLKQLAARVKSAMEAQVETRSRPSGPLGSGFDGGLDGETTERSGHEPGEGPEGESVPH